MNSDVIDAASTKFADRLNDVIGREHPDDRLGIALADHGRGETDCIKRVASRRLPQKLLR